jgi:polyhydroxybutyrate depolymerase
MSPVSPRITTQLARLASIFALGAALPSCGSLPTTASYVGGDYTIEFPDPNIPRRFNVHIPARGKGPAMPVILAFHGSSQTAEGLELQTGLTAAADAAGAIVVYPASALGVWDVTGDLTDYGFNDLTFVNRLLDRVEQDFVIDQKRVIAVGLSNGAVFVQRLACEMSDRLAGFVAVEGTLIRRLGKDCPPGVSTNALYLLGTADPFFALQGDATLFPIDSTLLFWANRAGCRSPRVSVQLPYTAHDGTTVWRSSASGCGKHKLQVTLDSIVGGGHGWAGAVNPPSTAFGVTTRNLSANAAILRFLDEVSLP